ncbi:DUF4255 domain-containing protein [Caballeronia sp. LZ035]|uniref:DUF4255 domain-containing protein n=1 Tax=Caballeronia sp. LZ035 TaxID=3038568 RepID=UPI002854B3E3|nr:DUF4255 domain-containing protein [Caballeronia sp. LZ035]MDR5761464.1 DUF4255 domain-containing protein [Caballeronia sp. LZ035]
MSADAIHQVTHALSARLERALKQASDPGRVFIGPLDDVKAKSASLILFLYRIAPCASLRNREHRVTSSAPPPPVLVFRNALPLDLGYLLTIGDTREGASEEIRLSSLGYAMRELNVDPDLTGPEVGNETAHISLDVLSLEDMSRVWALFPQVNYRTSVAYLVTPVWIDPPLPEPAAARVLQDSLSAGHVDAEAGHV